MWHKLLITNIGENSKAKAQFGENLAKNKKKTQFICTKRLFLISDTALFWCNRFYYTEHSVKC